MMRSIALPVFKVLIVLFMIAPTVGFVRVWPVNSASVDALVFLLSGLLAGAGFLCSKDASFKISVPVVFFLALLGSLAISVFFNSYSFEASWRWYLVCITFAIFVMLSANEVKSLDSIEFSFLLAKALLFGALVYCLASIGKYYGVFSLFLPWVQASEGRLSGIWSQPNLTTTMAWLGFVAASVVSGKSRNKFVLSLSVLVFGWVVASAASRMSWLILLALFALTLISRMPRFDAFDARAVRKNLVYGLTVMFLLLLVVPKINSPLREYLVDINWIDRNLEVALTDRVVTQDVARISEFSKLTSAISQFSLRQFLVGAGPGNYPSFSYKADMSQAPGNLISATWLHSHNLFTMIFVEFGAIGLIVILIGISLAVKVAFSTPIDSSRFLALGCLGIIFIHSNLEYPLWYPWFLIVTCLFLVCIFNTKPVHAETRYLKPALGSLIALMAVVLVINLGYQYSRIVKVAMTQDPEKEQYVSLSFLANDSLMGPYAILRKYRDFAPETTNLTWQLNEVRRMKAWQPRDLVMLREYTILVLQGNVDAACQAAESTAYRYPNSAPIMLEHALKSGVLNPKETITLAKCIERGLMPRGETIPSMQKKNQHALSKF